VRRTYRLYLNDILEAIERIEKHAEGLTLEDFSKNTMILDAVVRNLEIIGEAAKQIPEEIKKKQDKIPWKEIAGMRDKLSHNYFGVDIEIVWKTVEKRLPELKQTIKDLLKTADNVER
jgi:uncharacterized protein with HEPN domain